MPSGIVYVIAEFSLHSARVVAAGRPTAESVLDAFLDDFLPRVGLGHLTGPPRVVPCGAEPPPVLTDPWGTWAQAAAATLVIFDDEPACDDAVAAPPPGPAADHLAPVAVLPAERTGIIEYLSGPDSGFAHPLPIGAWTMGRTPAADIAVADPYLSRELLTLHNAPSGIQVRESGGMRSIPLAATAAVTAFGSTAARLIPPQTLSHTGQSTTTAPLGWPQIATVARPRAPSWLMYAAPIAIGIALAVFTQMWMFLLFSISGPVTAGIMYLTGRNRYRRDVLRACRDYREAVRDCLRRLAESNQQALDAAHRRRLTGGETTIGLGSALLPGGVRDIPVTAQVTTASATEDPLALAERRQLDEHLSAGAQFGQRHYSAADTVPVIIDLTLQRLQVEGPLVQVAAVLRAMLSQLTSRGLAIQLTTAQLLTVCPELAALPLTAPDEEEFVEVTGRPAADAGQQLEVQIGPGGDRGRSVETWLLRVSDDGAARLQVPAQAPEDLPRPLTGEIEPTRMRPERFLALNRAWQPPLPDWQQECTLGELLDGQEHPGGTADAAGDRSAVPLGRGPGGAALIDLFASGPHALLAGTTGSGKSVLLQTWIASLAARFSSAELRFVLIDFKGGAAFAPFSAFAHTDAVVSNLDPAAGMRTLRNLGAEILRRERLLAEHGAADIEAFNSGAGRKTPVQPLPRLVVIIDEFHALITEHPAGTEVLESLTAVGRSLGIHVVLATQRPAGIVTPRMKANINLRIALRVRDGVDSREVIECEDAAGIPPEQPGLGFLSDGGAPVPFRTATIDITADEAGAQTGAAGAGGGEAEHCEVQWTRLGDGPSAPRGVTAGCVRLRFVPPPQPPALTVSALADASQEAARRLPAPHTVIPPPLPVRAADDGDPALLGILDFPDDGVSESWRYDPGRDGSVVITGGSGAGATNALLRCGQAAATRGKSVIILSSGSPSASAVAGSQFVTFSHDHPWTLEYLLALFDLGAFNPADVCLCIDDYEALTARHETSRRLDRLAQLLTAGGAAAPMFVVVAGRRFLHSPIAARAATRIVFPTNDAQDSLHYGLPAGRFAGVWPPGRAVVLGPAARSQPAPANAREGVAVQLVEPDTGPPVGGTMDEADLIGQMGQAYRVGRAGRVGQASRADQVSEAGPGGCDIGGFQRIAAGAVSFRLGQGPLGEDIIWAPGVDGPVLTVRGPAELCHPLLADLAQPPADGQSPEVMALIDAHEADSAAAARAASAQYCAISYPLTAQLPYSSPLGAVTKTGPQLLLGLRQPAELAALGMRDLPLPPAGWAWFVSGSFALPVDVRSAAGQDSEIVS